MSETRFRLPKLLNFEHSRRYFKCNTLYFSTIFAISSVLLSGNVIAQSESKPHITHTQALQQAMIAEFDVERGDNSNAIDQYIPLAIYTPSNNAKYRALELTLEENNLDAAYAVTNAWVKQDPTDVPALLYLAHTSLSTQRYTQFVETIERILQVDSEAQLDQIIKSLSPDDENARTNLLNQLYATKQKNHPSLLIMIATLEAQNQQFESALKNINLALKKQPSTASFILLKAELLIAMDRQQEALKWLKKSANRYKKNTDIRLAEVQLLIKNKEEQLALDRLEETLKYNPNAEDALFLAGLTHIDFKNYHQAEKHLSKLTHSPRYQNDANYYLAINAERNQQLDTAIMYYTKVEGNLYTISRQEILKILEQKQQPDEALRFLTQERVNYPEYASFLYRAQADLLHKMGETEQAIQLLEEAQRDLTQDPEIIYAQVKLLNPHQNQQKLDVLLNRLLQLDPNNPNFLNAYAQTLALQNRQLKTAKRYIEQALYQMPTQSEFLNTLGYIAFLQNDFTTAIKSLKLAFEYNPTAETAVKYAKALYMNGNLTEFAQLLHELRKQYPDHSEVQQLDFLILPDHLLQMS